MIGDLRRNCGIYGSNFITQRSPEETQRITEEKFSVTLLKLGVTL